MLVVQALLCCHQHSLYPRLALRNPPRRSFDGIADTDGKKGPPPAPTLLAWLVRLRDLPGTSGAWMAVHNKVLVNYGDGCLWPGGSLW